MSQPITVSWTKAESFGFNTWPDGNECKPQTQAPNSPFRSLMVMLRHCLCLSTVCVCNIPVASAVCWYCTELEHPVKISHSSGCQYKVSHSKSISHICKPLPDKQELKSLHETKHFTNLSGCTGTEFKAELWFVAAFSRERGLVLAGSKKSRWLHCLFRSPQASRMVMESITGQQPSESTWRLLSWAH